MSYDPESGVLFEQVLFQEGDLLNITYTEKHERGDGVAVVRTVVVDGQRTVPVQYAEFMDALQALVDESLRALRNPPEHRTGR